MGEICIVLFIIGFLYNLFHDSKDAWKRGGYWKEAQEKGEEYFYDGTGAYRTSDGVKVSTHRDPHTGDYMECDLKTGKLINRSQLDRQEVLVRAKQNGYPSAIQWSSINYGEKNPYVDFADLRFNCYKDVETGRLLIIRTLNLDLKAEIHVFEDLVTGKWIRLTDEYTAREKYARENGYDYISDDVLSRYIHPLTEEDLNAPPQKSDRKIDLFTPGVEWTDWKWPTMSSAEKDAWIQEEMKKRTKGGLELVKWKGRVGITHYDWSKNGKIYKKPEKQIYDQRLADLEKYGGLQTKTGGYRKSTNGEGEFKYPWRIDTYGGDNWQWYTQEELKWG